MVIMEKISINAAEQKRLLDTYPLVNFHFDTNCFGYRCMQQYGLTNDSHENDKLIKDCYLEATINKKLEDLYPNLVVQSYVRPHSISVAVWIKRNGRDAEGLGTLDFLAVDFHDGMISLQETALVASEPNMFYCGGCKIPQSKSEYGYHYFSGKYCKVFGENNPQHKDRALRETYD